MSICDKIANKVQSTPVWRHDHEPHLDHPDGSHGDFATEPFAHPSENWFWLVCPCGAKHLINQEILDIDVVQERE